MPFFIDVAGVVSLSYTHRNNEILNESNEIAVLKKRLAMSGREALLLQNELDNKIKNKSDRALEMGQVCDCEGGSGNNASFI